MALTLREAARPGALGETGRAALWGPEHREAGRGACVSVADFFHGKFCSRLIPSAFLGPRDTGKCQREWAKLKIQNFAHPSQGQSHGLVEGSLEEVQQVHKPVEGSFGAAAGEQVVSDEEETLSCLHYRHPRPLPRIWPASCAPHSLGLLQGLRLLAPLPHWPFLSLLHSQQLKLCLNLSLEKKGQKPSSWAASGRPSHPSHPRSCLP